jgi:hypothetical protein
MAATLLPFLPSEKRICDPRHHEMATAILTLADGLEAHIPGSRKRIADLEAILWAPLTGAFAGRYMRWSDSQRTKNMRNRRYSLMLHYAQLFEVTQYPSLTETLAKRMQDAADAATAGDQLRCEVEQGRLVHRANMNAHYEGALGTRPSSYGNSGLYHFNPVLVGAYDLLPSQPCVCVCVFVMVIGGSGEVRASASEKGSKEKKSSKTPFSDIIRQRGAMFLTLS